MKGVWSWANHIQAPSYGLQNYSGILEKIFKCMKVRRLKNQGLHDEGVDCSSHRMREFVWDFVGAHRVP